MSFQYYLERVVNESQDLESIDENFIESLKNLSKKVNSIISFSKLEKNIESQKKEVSALKEIDRPSLIKAVLDVVDYFGQLADPIASKIFDMLNIDAYERKESKRLVRLVEKKSYIKAKRIILAIIISAFSISLNSISKNAEKIEIENPKYQETLKHSNLDSEEKKINKELDEINVRIAIRNLTKASSKKSVSSEEIQDVLMQAELQGKLNAISKVRKELQKRKPASGAGYGSKF